MFRDLPEQHPGRVVENRLTLHGNATNDTLTQMLSDLQCKALSILLGVESVENGGEFLGIEFLSQQSDLMFCCVDIVIVQIPASVMKSLGKIFPGSTANVPRRRRHR